MSASSARYSLWPERLECGRYAGAGVARSEGSLYTGGPLRVVWLYLAGYGQHEAVDGIAFDAVWRFTGVGELTPAAPCPR